ncbi:VanZ family protein [Corynebacterium kalidii]|jgi:glycopeptide antibiotics resistance protein|uniref:VanZ family protein n=1 Tax=Corynebacterium kalidii TaxID=2931982 RepID=A0A9X1WI35_9CORY|nr:VanZ family protein [Corynebacterium kalidii]MCJ7858007.1 VanZ family protein [Corynebacterium kalidii]
MDNPDTPANPTDTVAPARHPRWRAWVTVTLVGYAAVVVALTTLKAFYTIGLLWKPENQRVRDLRPVPFGIISDSSTTFGWVFDILGNLAFFVPLGMLLMILSGRWRWTVGVAAVFSLGIEVTQYVFSLGRTDVTDLICNTVGAAVGAWIACWFSGNPTRSRQWQTLLTMVVGLAVLVFVVLVILGPALGDPDKVVGN